MNTHQPSGGAPDEPSVEDVLAAALREERIVPEARERVLSAFRASRDTGALTARTRRADDWRTHRPRRFPVSGRAWRATAGTFLVSLALGGVAVATFGMPHVPAAPFAGRESSPPAAASSASAVTPGKPHSPVPPPQPAPTGAATPENTPSGYPPPSRASRAHCRGYARAQAKGRTLKGAAWRRLVRAAGGAGHVQTYCAALLAEAATRQPDPMSPEKTPQKTTGKGTPQKKALERKAKKDAKAKQKKSEAGKAG